MNEQNESSQSQGGIDLSQANDASIIKCHARLRRKPPSASAVKFFSYMILVVVIGFAFVYQRRHMADYDSQMYLSERTQIAALVDFQNRPTGPEIIDYLALGEQLYTKQACIGCHQPNGQGLPGQFPPLAGSEYVAREDASLAIKILLAGLSGPVTVKGQPYNGAMPSYGALKDKEIAGLVTYIRHSWENAQGEVTQEQVKAIRDEIGARGNYTAADLKSYFE